MKKFDWDKPVTRRTYLHWSILGGAVAAVTWGAMYVWFYSEEIKTWGRNKIERIKEIFSL